ncbi:hypothetical protein EJ05DRAFT_327181 [Pseudovirgaria hyperparasitica]|uniref:Uncharacterized protein n=1 Tax=Pseudovirgaria hyperparasitica TaxID=470096 RepID=A0A6A6WA86_9PEZI|nr:uncharacterized protein EJ05DRAFT_327181 [Pseudovirgaria hyperparasitica]KAF2758944.1 hypothetical protein EJ05DRAFT_327181 [Pseudovirgaria hyperparasitica]
MPSTPSSDTINTSKAHQVTHELPDVCPRPLPGESVQTWSFLVDSVATNAIGDLRRTPSQLSQYNDWAARIRKTYGSVGAFVIQRRLQWVPRKHDADGTPLFETVCGEDGNPLADSRDYKVLRNDWPYGIEDGITHLCVWMKGRLGSGDEVLANGETGRRGQLTKQGRACVDQYVYETFTKPLREKANIQGEEVVFNWAGSSNGGGDGVHVLWFKNWIELQSVRGIDHIHVLLRGATEGMVEAWLDG